MVGLYGSAVLWSQTRFLQLGGLGVSADLTTLDSITAGTAGMVAVIQSMSISLIRNMTVMSFWRSDGLAMADDQSVAPGH